MAPNGVRMYSLRRSRVARADKTGFTSEGVKQVLRDFETSDDMAEAWLLLVLRPSRKQRTETKYLADALHGAVDAFLDNRPSLAAPLSKHATAVCALFLHLLANAPEANVR